MDTRRDDALRYLAHIRKYEADIVSRLAVLEQAIGASEDVSAALATEARDIRLQMLLQTGTALHLIKALEEAAGLQTSVNLGTDDPKLF